MTAPPAHGSVIVVGSINVDLVVVTDRLPSPGETVIGGAFSRAQGGKGANPAAAAAALGARTYMVGLVGDDDLGRGAVADLRERGVDVSGVGTVDAPTGVALIMVDAAGENLIAVASGANGRLDGARVLEALTQLGSSEAVLLASLEIADDAVEAAATAAGSRGWRSILNTAPARSLSPDLLGRFDVVIANEHEIEGIVTGSVEGLLELGVHAVVVTRGAAGADLHRPDAPVVHQAAYPVEVLDTTGAGDAFCGAFAASLAEDGSLELALRVGAAAGALASRAVGARASLGDAAAVGALIEAPTGD